MNAIIYNRKSRGTEEDLLKNRTEMIDYCKRNNFNYEYLEEIGSSVDEERQGFQKLIELVKTKKYQVIVIMELSRLTRSLKIQLELFDILAENNVVIHSVLDGDIINPSNQMNEMMSIFKGAFNQMVYKETSKKMSLGRLQSARSGKWLNVAPFGYYKDNDMKLAINELEAPIIKQMFSLIIEGHSITQVYKILYEEGKRTRTGHVFHDSTISGLLRNRAYLGEVIYESKEFNETVVVKDAHPAIISYEEFYQVREILEQRKGFQERISKVLSPLDKLIYCKNCKRKMLISRGNSGTRSKYVNINRCAYYNGIEKCQNKGITISYVLPYVYQQIEAQIPIIKKELEEVYKERYDGKIESLQAEKKAILKEIKDKEKQQRKLLDVLLNGVINEVVYSEKEKQLSSEIQSLKLRYEDIESIIIQRSIKNDTERMENILESLHNLSTKPEDEQNRILRNVIERIEYLRKDDELEVDIFFKN